MCPTIKLLLKKANMINSHDGKIITFSDSEKKIRIKCKLSHEQLGLFIRDMGQKLVLKNK